MGSQIHRQPQPPQLSSLRRRDTTTMEITSQADGSSPLATVEQIRKRLIRPPSLHSQSSSSSTTLREDVTSCYSSRLDVNSVEFGRKIEDKRRNVTNKRLEDYLDPTLLSEIRAKIGGNRKRGREMVQKESAFEWPTNQLEAWKEVSRSEEAVDLGDDVDVIRGVGEEEEEEEMWCTPFQRFERAALKRF